MKFEQPSSEVTLPWLAGGWLYNSSASNSGGGCVLSCQCQSIVGQRAEQRMGKEDPQCYGYGIGGSRCDSTWR
jgi:hypothetical protein